MHFNRLLPWLLPAILQAQSVNLFSIDILNSQFLSDEDHLALESILDNPVNLNTATPVDLWFLNDSLVSVLMAARQSGPFRDWKEVAQRTSLAKASIQALRQLLELPLNQRIQGRLSTRIVTSGTDERIRTRLNLDGDRWTLQWVAQRDPGEYHLADLSDLSARIDWGATSIYLGAHRVTWGLGLVLGREFPTPRGASLLRPISKVLSIRKGYSNSNTGVLRGISIQHQWMRLKFISGYCFQGADISIETDGYPRVIAYRTHTETALTTREALPYLGATVSVGHWKFGGLAAWHDLQSTSTTPGVQQLIYSLYTERTFQNHLGKWHISHEEARRTTDRAESRADGGARQTRLMFIKRPALKDSQMRLTLMYRHYPSDWTPLRGRLVGNQASRGNEAGWFLVWQWHYRFLKITGHLDSYHEIESRELQLWPSNGWESGLAVAVRWRPLEASLNYREYEDVGYMGSQNPYGLDILQREVSAGRYLRFSLSYVLSRNLTARCMTVITGSDAGEKQGGGETLGGSLRYRLQTDAILTIGANRFKTDGWDLRIYTYEEGLPGEFNFQPLFGRGVRVYGKLSLPIGEGLVSLRAAQQWRSTDQSRTETKSHLQLGIQMDIAL
ncbi:MAG: hypothetical protein JSW54_00090 [Fidelibacterota bacterium]|nr:MAG: hypothetical protein JSW54_00090 [Candidatus Neomarinimicrobiota bacterium]